MSERAPTAGQVVGGYRLTAPLGGGGMGEVWLAEHTVLGRPVAIKLLRASLSRQPEMVERFFDEARAATRVADPGIVTIHDFGWHTDGQAYLVMEHLTGETLAQRLQRRGRLEPGEALRVVRQTALAMAAAHAASIIHRDLKPDNIFVVADPAVVGGERVKVLDFGIAKLLGAGAPDHAWTQTGALLGTPMYMSPEQCRSAGRVDPRADVYSLGCVLFHLLTGVPPFSAASIAEVIAGHLMTAPPSPRELAPAVSPAIEAVVLRCLAKAADERWPSMLALADALAAAADDVGEVATAPPRPSGSPSQLGAMSTLAAGAVETAPVPARGRGLGLLAVVGVAVALTGFGITTALRDRSPPSAAGLGPPAGSGAAHGSSDAGPTAAAARADRPPLDAGAAGLAAPADAAPSAAGPDAGRGRRRPRYDPYATR